mmetsp:Transcript_64850/g.204780  ORF Transcript_64850/g.204780 Transcript_64850/m.204780 type:complete len:320 (+) Transcript_64850:174-1133(+)
MKLWLDVDAGVDDAQGMMIAFVHPGVEIVGISCVCGNVDVDQVARNVARILTLCGREDIPFYVGAREPLVMDHVDASHFHGKDGMGDRPNQSPGCASITLQPRSGHGAVVMAEKAKEMPGEITVVAVGPLTNLAMAYKLDHTFPLSIKKLVVMGGAIEAQGNHSAVSEFNFGCDPEAACVVMQKFSRPDSLVNLVCWEMTLKHGVPFEFFDKMSLMETRKARFMCAVLEQSITWMKDEKQHHEKGWIACDPLAVAAAVDASMVLETEDVYCQIELAGNVTRGMSVLDRTHLLKSGKNVRLITKMDVPRFMDMLLTSVRD